MYKQQIKSCKFDLSNAWNHQRSSSYSVQQKSERRQLLHGQEIIDSTDDALLRGKQIIAHTEETAIDSNRMLHEQGHKLEHALEDLHETNDVSDRARRIMYGMARRMMTDRIIQFIIVFLELGIIGFLLYWKFK